MIPRARFEVGEVVIIQSKHYPEYNGKETTILARAYCDSDSAATGESSGYVWVYATDYGHEEGEGWNQSALRKKHDGCGESLADIIARLNTIEEGVRV